MKTIKKALSLFLTVVMIVSIVPMTKIEVNAATTPPNVTETTLYSRFETLKSKLNNKYFTVNQSYCNPPPGVSGHGCSNCKNTSVYTASWFPLMAPSAASNIPKHFRPGSTITSPAYSCAGFAGYAQWYLYASQSTDNVIGVQKGGTITLSYNNLKSVGARIGDVLGSSGHSMVIYSYNSSGISYIQCNGTLSANGNCKVTYHENVAYSTLISYYGNSFCVTGCQNFTDTPSDTYATITEGTYYIKSTVNQNYQYLIVDENKDVNSQNISVWTYTGVTGEQMTIKKTTDGYKILPGCSSTGKVVNVASSTVSDGINVTLYQDNNNATQWWKFVKVGSAYKIVSSANPSVCLTIDTDAHNVRVKTYTGAANQLWTLEPCTYKITLNNSGADSAGTTAYWYKHNTVTNGIYYYSDSDCTIGLTNGYDIVCPKKTGYTFGGYYTEENGKGTQYVDSKGTCVNNIYKTIGNKTLYAQWTPTYLPSKTFTYNGHIYEIYPHTVTWEEANTLCNTFGGHLATITNLNEQNAVAGYFDSTMPDGLWIGLTDKETEGTFKWVTGEAFSYSNWDTTGAVEPNNDGDEDYGMLYTCDIETNVKGCWNDSGSSLINGFICEYETSSLKYTSSMQSASGKTYYLFEQKMPWTAANEFAKTFCGGRLATIKSSTEQSEINTLLNSGSKSYYWIGLSRYNDSTGTTGDTFSWSDGSALSYNNYLSGEPNSLSSFEYFIEVDKSNGLWDDVKNFGREWSNNTVPYGFIVEKATTYPVTYNANGGTNAPAAQTKTYGVNLTLSSTKPTRTGYTFQGWATSSTATSAAYASGAAYSGNAALTLYAVWKVDTYTVSYNANGGTGAPATQTKTYGVSLTLSSTKPTRTGYTFQGWATAANATAVDYASGAAFTGNYNAALYAVWKANTYTVNFNANGGSCSTASKSVTYDSTYGTLPTAEKTGHSFAGWFTAASGGTNITASTKVAVTAAQTLYAHFTPNTYTVTFNANGGTNAPASQTKTYGVNLTLTSAVPTRDKYIFTGWATTANAAKATYAPGGTYTANSAVTLYAVWKLAHTHSYTSEITTKATCTTDGIKTFRCGCGDTYTEVIPATGHKTTIWITEEKATCTENGLKVEYCLDCSELVQTEVIPATGHIHTEFKVVTNATCTKDGLQKEYCLDCKALIGTEVIPALGHRFVLREIAGEHPHDETYKCIRCGETKQEAGKYCETCPECNFTVTAVNASSVKISGYNGSLAKLTVPAKIGGKSVTATATGALKANTALTEVKIESGIAEIGSLTFMNCANLKRAVIPESVTTIGTYAFYGCDEDFTIYCYGGSAAQNYAEDNGIAYVIMDIGETEKSEIDYGFKYIFTNENAVTNIADLIYTPAKTIAIAEASFAAGGSEYLGTGSVITVFANNKLTGEYTVIVDGDLDGDSVSDVLDAALAERIANGHENASAEQVLAATGESGEALGVSDYAALVNKVLAK